MKADKSIKVLITGHTDNTGDAAKNLNYYGVKRAEALKNYMVSQGVSADQITCESKGQTQPVAPSYYCLFRLQIYYLLGIYKQ